MPKYLNGTIVDIKDVNSTTKRFWVEVEGVEKIEYKPGQFVTMELPIHEKRLKRMRSYSIAGPPTDSNVLEFIIVRLEKGLATTYLFEEAKIGTPLKFKPPAGVFTLPPVLDKDLVFVCTGTGVAPFRSMILNIYREIIPHKKIHLIFGTRYQQGILYRKEFEDLAEQYDNFSYSIVLSREKAAGTFQGYVHDFYKLHYSEPEPTRDFYLCGWSAMVDEAVETLGKLGYEKSQIKYELYG